MSTCIKIVVAVFSCSLCISAMAANRFIVKYKLTEAQEAYLSSSDVDKEETREKIREELMERLSQEQLDALSEAANAQVEYLHSLAIGAHVITLSEDLDEIQTEQFIHNVEQFDDIDFIEKDREVNAW